MSVNWNTELVEQLDWHWRFIARPRLDSLSDDEYFWEPVPDCWSIRPSTSIDPAAPVASAPLWGTGPFRMELAEGDPDPAPVTTVAWRLAHMIVEVLGERVHSHFDGPQVVMSSFPFAGTAREALAQLDTGYERWIEGVKSLGDAGLARACGPSEGPFAEAPLAALVLHINREMLHHNAEVMLLRDLYRVSGGGPLPDPASTSGA